MSQPSAYEQLGVSATKDEIHEAVRHLDQGLFPSAFCRIGADVLGDDPDWCCAVHADDAGTKVLVAYLCFRETGDARIFRGAAQDAVVMNLDDLLCVGACDRFLLSNTINRNSFRVPGSVIGEIIAGYDDFLQLLRREGISIVATGGETADMTDSVRTLIVGATLTTRLRRDQVIDNCRIQPGDVIVGLSSTGQARYETHPNSGIGDNGLTLARHALLQKHYLETYPETVAEEIDRSVAYRGPFALADRPESLGMSVAQALSSPTRTYAPIVREAVGKLGAEGIHGMVHCTGGGQGKCIRFGRGVRFCKDNLFPCPPLFQLIAEHGNVSWPEMYQTFNMGHRFELMVPPGVADTVTEISNRYGVAAQVVGHCESAASNSVVIDGEYGTIELQPSGED